MNRFRRDRKRPQSRAQGPPVSVQTVMAASISIAGTGFAEAAESGSDMGISSADTSESAKETVSYGTRDEAASTAHYTVYNWKGTIKR